MDPYCQIQVHGMLPCQHISQSSLVKLKVTNNRLSTDTMFAHHGIGGQAERDPMFAIISAGFAIGPRGSCLLTSTRASAHIVWHTSKEDCPAYLTFNFTKNIFKCKSVKLGSAHNLTSDLIQIWIVGCSLKKLPAMGCLLYLYLYLREAILCIGQRRPTDPSG